MLEDKVRDVFSDMVVLKNPERTEFFSNLSLPSYMRDWLVMKFSDDDGIIDYDSVLRYIRQYIPSREDFEQFKFEMVNGETVRFLARIRVNVDIKTGKTLFELPDFGGSRSGASGEVANDVVSRWKETLLKESENWGNATCKDDIPDDEFIKYCLEPAKEMRGVIKRQLCIIDPKEFNVPGKKDIPDIQYNYL